MVTHNCGGRPRAAVTEKVGGVTVVINDGGGGPVRMVVVNDDVRVDAYYAGGAQWWICGERSGWFIVDGVDYDQVYLKLADERGVSGDQTLVDEVVVRIRIIDVDLNGL